MLGTYLNELTDALLDAALYWPFACLRPGQAPSARRPVAVITAALDDGASLILFSEGTRSAGG